MLFLEAKEKDAYLQQDDKKYSPEDTSGVYNESVFFWLRRILIQGTKKVLEIDDLYALNEDLATENISPKFQKAWDTSMSILSLKSLEIQAKDLTFSFSYSEPRQASSSHGDLQVIERAVCCCDYPEIVPSWPHVLPTTSHPSISGVSSRTGERENQ